MKNFYTGLMTYFNAAPGGVHNSFWTSVGGRLYKGQAPKAATYPYAVFSLISCVPTYTFGGSTEEAHLQFDLYSITASSVEVEDAMTNLKALFDNCWFSVTSKPMIDMNRINTMLVLDEDITSTGTQNVWHYIAEYKVTLDP